MLKLSISCYLSLALIVDWTTIREKKEDKKKKRNFYRSENKKREKREELCSHCSLAILLFTCQSYEEMTCPKYFLLQYQLSLSLLHVDDDFHGQFKVILGSGLSSLKSRPTNTSSVSPSHTLRARGSVICSS
jgi:hypothetical protein